jgi:hypothetical protein
MRFSNAFDPQIQDIVQLDDFEDNLSGRRKKKI